MEYRNNSSFQRTFNSHEAFEMSIKENKNKQPSLIILYPYTSVLNQFSHIDLLCKKISW